MATSPTSRAGPTAPTSSESTTARSWGSRSVMASPAAPSSSSCGRLSPTPRSTASPTRSRAPTYAHTRYDLGGDDPEKFQPQDGRPEGPPAPVSPRIGSRWKVEYKASTMRMWLRAARYKRPEVRESRSLWQMVESRAVRRGGTPRDRAALSGTYCNWIADATEQFFSAPPRPARRPGGGYACAPARQVAPAWLW